MLFATDFPVRQAHNLRGSSLYYNCPDGTQMLFWSDTPDGHADIFALKINPEGDTAREEPIAVIDNPGDQRLLDGKLTSDGCYILLWAEYNIYDTYELRLQKIDPSGQRLWISEGVALGGAMFQLDKAFLAANSVGGAYVVYTSYSAPGIVFGQNYNGDGNPLWTADTALFTHSSDVSLCAAVSDGAGGIIVNVSKYVNNYPRTYLVRFNFAGNVVGNNPLVSSTLFPGEQFDIMEGIPGQFILWHLYEGEGNVRFRKIDNQGNLLPTQWYAYALGNLNYLSDLDIAPTADGGLVMAWSWWDSGYEPHIRVQKFAANMTSQWPEADLPIADDMYEVMQISLATHSNGNTWLGYTEFLENQSLFHKAHLINADGSLAWGPNGITLAANNTSSTIIPRDDRATYVWMNYEDGSTCLRLQVLGTNGNQYLPQGGLSFIHRLYGQAYLKGSIALQDSYFLAWDDGRGGSRIYYQLLDQNQNALLEPDGRALAAGNVIQAVAKVGTNSAAVLYYDVVEGYSTYYVQLIDANGNPVYPGNGIDLTISGDGWPQDLCMSSFGDDIYLAWQQYSPNYLDHYIMGQRISNGQKMWGPNGRVLVTYSQNTLIQNYGFTGRYLLWRLEDYEQNQISCKALMLDPNGDPIPGWAPGGMDICMNSTDIYNQGIEHSGLAGEDLVAFMHTSAVGQQAVRAQRISPLGQRLWQDAGTQIQSPGQGVYLQDAIYGAQTVVLLQEIGLPSDKFYMQQISPDGVLLLPGTGYELASNLNVPQNATLSRYEDGRWLCAWTDDDGVLIEHRDVYIRLLAPDGTPLGTAPELFCGARYKQYALLVSTMGNQALLAWNDDRAGIMNSEVAYTGVWAGFVTSNGTPVVDEHTPSPAISLGANYPNPFNPSTSIPFSLAESGTVSIGIYNIRGQLVRGLLTSQILPSGKHSVTWNGLDDHGKAVASGIYLYRMAYGGKVLSRRMVLSK
jgi:hypothetical protein